MKIRIIFTLGVLALIEDFVDAKSVQSETEIETCGDVNVTECLTEEGEN